MEDKSKQTDEKTPKVIEDLTVNEAEMGNVKGGSASQYLLRLEGVKGESGDHK